MTDRNEDLHMRTHKGLDDLAKRVFYTLTDERKSTRAIALLVEHLHQKGLLSDEEIDTMLLAAIGERDY